MKTIVHRRDSEFSATSQESLETVQLRTGLRHKPTGLIIPKGTVFSVLFGTLAGDWVMRVSAVVPGLAEDGSDSVHYSTLTRHVAWFFAPPSINDMLESEEYTGSTCPSVLGEIVEPDGIDEHGSPSWMKALRLI